MNKKAVGDDLVSILIWVFFVLLGIAAVYLLVKRLTA